MSNDIEKALAYQVKKEIAQRYFRIRKLIEDDSENLQHLLKKLENIYNKIIKKSLFRIYTLLGDKAEIEEFSQKIGLTSPPFLNEFNKLSLGEKVELLKDIHGSGWFKFWKHADMLLKGYEFFYKNWQDYFDLKEEVLDELAILKEELDHFTRNYSLDEIMHFLRGLNLEDEAMKGALGAGIEKRGAGTLDKEMAIEIDLKKFEEKIPELDKVPKPDEIKSFLKKLAHKSYFKNKKTLLRLI